MLINLRWKIQTAGRKNYEVAQQASLSESKLSRVLAGRAELTAGEQDRIAKALGVEDRTWLFQNFNIVPRSYVCNEPAAIESASR